MDARGLAAWVSSTCKGVVLFGMRVCAVKVRIPGFGGRIIATKVELNHGTGQNEFILYYIRGYGWVKVVRGRV